jgi:GNAT superfamily N-acetyltransferase
MIRIREIVDPADPALTEAYDLLKQSFTRGERVALREWRDSLHERSGKLLTDLAWHLLVAEDDGRIVGLNSGSYLGNVNLGMIGYLAIAPEARSRGIGTRLRNRLRTVFERDAIRITGTKLAGIIGEVSLTNPWLRTLNRRSNVLLLDFPYYQPSLTIGDEPSPFILYLESFQGDRARMPVTELRKLLYTVWRRVYRVSRPLDRAAFRAMLRNLQKRRYVGRRKLPKTESR